MTVTIVCVLKSGGDFHEEHLHRWMGMVDDYAPVTASWGLMTDVSQILAPSPVGRLNRGWPGWWSKLEVFRIPGPAMYMDLDVSVIGDLTPLLEAAQQHDFIAAANFWSGDPHKINSSVMAWRGDASCLYEKFSSDPERFMEEGKRRDRWGDQGFIAEHWPGTIDTWQELLPGHVVSYKRGYLAGESVSDCRVLVSHGRPRPWEPGGADHDVGLRKAQRRS